MIDEALKDLNVLDFSWVVAGPSIGRTLADFGATVIRIETRKKTDTARLIGPFHNGIPGVENSALYGNMNAGKLGLTIDMSNPEAKEIILDLVRWADVLIESFSTSVMKKWGLDYNNLKKINPQIIVASSSLMGATGPYSTVSGFGNIGSAMSGCTSLAGWDDKPPDGPFGPYTDYVAPKFSLIALLAAMDYRNRTDEGCHIDISQVESSIHFIAQGMLDFFENGKCPENIGNQDYQLAPHGVYPCLNEQNGDNSYVAIAIRNDNEWQAFAKLIDENGLSADKRYLLTQDRLQNKEGLEYLIKEFTRKKTAEEIERVLQDVGIPAHKVSTSSDIIMDSQLNHLGYFIQLDHSLHGKTVVEGARYTLSNTPANVRRCAPLYGQDNLYILEEVLKYLNDKIRMLEDSGVLE